MDKMLINTAWARGHLSEILSSIISEKTGFDVELNIANVDIINDENTTKVRLKIDSADVKGDIPHLTIDNVLKKIFKKKES